MGFLEIMADSMKGPSTGGIPDTSNATMLKNYENVNNLTQTLDSLTKAAQTGDEYYSGKMSPLGLDAVIQDWVRQQFIYRRSILQDLFIIAFQVTEVRSAILSIKREMFRKGFGPWEQKFAKKCPDCNKEFQEEDIEECDSGCFEYEIKTEYRYDDASGIRVPIKVRKYRRDESGKKISTKTVAPDSSQQQVFEDFIDDSNVFHKSLLDTLKEFFEDVLTVDDGFLLLNKEYIIDAETGQVAYSRVYEITRLHPALVEYDIDRKDGLPERSHWLCPIHRNQQVHTGPGTCDLQDMDNTQCGGELMPALYRYYWRGRYRYYLKDEIIHQSYFSPSKTYGYPPVLTVFEKVLTLLGIDRWYYRYFYERRIPPGLIITYTDDPESMESEIERIRTRMLDDPNTFPWIAASAKTQRGRTDHIKLGYTFEEMDSISIRQEIRERVAMLWGVTPMHQGDTSSVGGLTRETAQTAMFDNLIESYQGVINNGVIPILLKEMGITDWTRSITAPKEKTEQEKLELEKMRIENATAMQNIGYKAVKIPGKEIHFNFEEAPLGTPGMPPPGGGGAGQQEQLLPPPPSEDEIDGGQEEEGQEEEGLPKPPPEEQEDEEV